MNSKGAKAQTGSPAAKGSQASTNPAPHQPETPDTIVKFVSSSNSELTSVVKIPRPAEVEGGGSDNQAALQAALAQARAQGKSRPRRIERLLLANACRGSDGSSYNASMGNVCYEAYSACQTSCQSMASTYGSNEFSAIAHQCGQLSKQTFIDWSARVEYCQMPQGAVTSALESLQRNRKCGW